MRRLLAATLLAFLALMPMLTGAQEDKRPAAQQGSEPNYGTRPDASTGPGGQEVRPGNRDGDAPSASAGRLTNDPTPRRIFGLPTTAVLVISAVILGLLAIAGVVLPASRRRRARGNGTYGR
jgi:hypothetical protein